MLFLTWPDKWFYTFTEFSCCIITRQIHVIEREKNQEQKKFLSAHQTLLAHTPKLKILITANDIQKSGQNTCFFMLYLNIN